MGWNNNNWNDRRGYNNYGGGGRRRPPQNWDSRDSRDYGGYPPENRGYGGYSNDVSLKYNIGQRCKLVNFPDTIVAIIRLGREQYECRLPDLTTQWFYENELEPVD